MLGEIARLVYGAGGAGFELCSLVEEESDGGVTELTSDVEYRATLCWDVGSLGRAAVRAIAEGRTPIVVPFELERDGVPEMWQGAWPGELAAVAEALDASSAEGGSVLCVLSYDTLYKSAARSLRA